MVAGEMNYFSSLRFAGIPDVLALCFSSVAARRATLIDALFAPALILCFTCNVSLRY